MSDGTPEPDRAPGAPHPRMTETLFGQARAEADFLDAFNGGRLHHGWLLTGPMGVGKATLAWRIARFLLSRPEPGGGLFGDPEPPHSLDTPEDHPVSRRIAGLGEPRAFLLRRAWDHERKRLKTQITVDEARRLKHFFQMSSDGSGHRVAIVDCADELNPNAANALLKLLEEPPKGAVLLLVSHQPARLLPTIRSRCRVLRLGPLGADDMARGLAGAGIEMPDRAEALAELAGGSVGQAIRIISLDGQARYGALVSLLADAPRIDRLAAIALAEQAATRGDDDHFTFLADLLDIFLTRMARMAATGIAPAEAAPGEIEAMTRLAPDTHAARGWASLQQSLGARARIGHAVNLDPAALFLDTLLKINDAARDLAA